MKPHELVKRLVERDGGSLPVAKAMRRPGFQPTLHRYCDGQVSSPQRATAEAIAGHFGIPVDAIYSAAVATQVAYKLGFVEGDPPPAVAEANVSPITPRSRVPLISWIQAGGLREIEDNFQPGEGSEWIDVYDTKAGEHAFALEVEGNSMVSLVPGDPTTFPEGTIIIVDPSRAANAGDYVIAKDVLTQQATFKKLVTDGGRWFLQPLNTNYPTVEIDDPALRVIGRVVESYLRRKL